MTGDATHHPVQWAEPDWRMVADVEPAQAAATRKRLLVEHVGRTLVIGTHYAPPCAGRLEQGAQGVVFRARA